MSSFDARVNSAENTEFCRSLDRDLVDVWLIMKKFCLLTNLGTETRMLIQPATIYDTMVAVMYRLLHMSFTSGTLDETLRLGLLAFTHHIFLQWQDIILPHSSFSNTYRKYLQAHALGARVPPSISLWLFFIGALSLFHVSDEQWLGESLREAVELCGVTSWKDAQEILKASMWISLLDDKSGKQIYDSVTEMPDYTLDV